MTKTFSVGVLSFNHPDLTARCVQSILAHVMPDQITLLHNGSRPEVEARLRSEFSGIHHVTLPKNLGFSGGANALLNVLLERAPWALLVTNDCELLQLSAPPLNPGFFAPLIYRRSSSKVDSIGGLFRPLTGRLRHRRSDRQGPMEVISQRLFGDYFYIPGTAFWAHQSAWAQLGGFDETLHTYWEDVDLSVRAHHLRVKLGTCPETVFKHGVGKTCHKDKFYTQHLFWRNRALVSRRYTAKWLRPIQKLLHQL